MCPKPGQKRIRHQRAEDNQMMGGTKEQALGVQEPQTTCRNMRRACVTLRATAQLPPPPLQLSTCPPGARATLLQSCDQSSSIPRLPLRAPAIPHPYDMAWETSKPGLPGASVLTSFHSRSWLVPGWGRLRCFQSQQKGASGLLRAPAQWPPHLFRRQWECAQAANLHGLL